MEKRDFLSSESGDVNSLNNNHATYKWKPNNAALKIKLLAWLMAFFSLVANFTLILMKYVNPIVTSTTTTSFNISFIILLS